MNFLLHHAWALRERDEQAFAAGSMLPDLWRMAERRARVGSRHFRLPEASTDAALAGVAHHLEVDAWFHADAWFVDGEAATLRAMQEAGVQSEKMLLFAHPLWELCLDGALVRRSGWASTARMLAATRAEVGGALGIELAERLGLAQLLPAGDDRARFAARMESLWDALEEGPWIGAYTSPAGLAECIARMRQRVRVSPLVAGDQARLERAIATLEPLADESVRVRLPQLPR